MADRATTSAAAGPVQGEAPRAGEASPDAAAIAEAARLKARQPHADPLARLPDVHPTRLPRHIAIIMDGNGRWAKERGFPRIFGHRNGARAVRETIEECSRLGTEHLTLYSFSSENWRRPADEVDALMQLAVVYLSGEAEQMAREGVRLRVIGRVDALPPEVRGAIARAMEATRGGRALNLNLAINYGSRAEIVDAARSLARDAARGALDPEAIDEGLVASRLYTHDLPDPDLLIRTAGEMRVSNFLLWQLSYAEIVVTRAYWPEFGATHLHEAIREFAGRTRRFGAIDAPPGSPAAPDGAPPGRSSAP